MLAYHFGTPGTYISLIKADWHARQYYDAFNFDLERTGINLLSHMAEGSESIVRYIEQEDKRYAETGQYTQLRPKHISEEMLELWAKNTMDVYEWLYREDLDTLELQYNNGTLFIANRDNVRLWHYLMHNSKRLIKFFNTDPRSGEQLNLSMKEIFFKLAKLTLEEAEELVHAIGGNDSSSGEAFAPPLVRQTLPKRRQPPGTHGDSSM